MADHAVPWQRSNQGCDVTGDAKSATIGRRTPAENLRLIPKDLLKTLYPNDGVAVNHPELEVSTLLRQVRQGDQAARDRLFLELQSELRQMAAALMRRERPDHTLQATALVNEACVRLLDSDAIANASDRRYFFGMANRAMRQILVDHSRKRGTSKRGGEYQRGSLDIVLENFETDNGCRFDDLEAALERLEGDSPRQREVIELRFFSGLSIAEVADVLEVSVGTVERDWRLARAKLFRQLRGEQQSSADGPA